MHRQRESDSKSAVEDANAKFYSAFRNRDLKVLLHLMHAIAQWPMLRALKAALGLRRLLLNAVEASKAAQHEIAALPFTVQGGHFCKHYKACMTWGRSLRPKRRQWQDCTLPRSCLALMIAHMPSVEAIRGLRQPQMS